jgi:hypothetical protein
MKTWMAGNFEIDDYLNPPAAGFQKPKRWNGFAMPAFEKQEADRIAEAFGDVVFDAEKDAYICDMGYPEEEPEAFKGFDIEVDGEKRHVYAIGSGFWVWTNYEQTDAE